MRARFRRNRSLCDEKLCLPSEKIRFQEGEICAFDKRNEKRAPVLIRRARFVFSVFDFGLFRKLSANQK